MTFFQVSKPSSAVPFVAIPALFRRTATYSSTCSLVSTPISPKLRQKQNKTENGEKHTIGGKSAHLSKGFICLVLEPLHLLGVAHVGGDDKHVLLADLRRNFASEHVHIFHVDIGEDDPKAMPEQGTNRPVCQSIVGWIDSRSNAGGTKMKTTHRASSIAAARPMPDAAPVMTATRPHWKAGCSPGSKGERICVSTGSPRPRSQANEVRASDRGTREGWGRLCWAPASPSRPLCRSALLGAAKHDGSGT